MTDQDVVRFARTSCHVAGMVVIDNPVEIREIPKSDFSGHIPVVGVVSLVKTKKDVEPTEHILPIAWLSGEPDQWSAFQPYPYVSRS